eukprot:CAMPEP_0202902306 /NCGR_PEP_ID=MMETSP1392-20130828/16780_1 /ASSEMBLY_ACC=CAM_ASM_000868 /TAXON_ID=225041 /ORGANISM="Chlamydomonas chlamydogama, Strain SAG 11-48b" /LENGTH=238 /DNA_ID=CAMNT_0049589055 /DNA_START=34 /DNA_END=746 /DNA_ORIENTATION=-
MAISTISSLHIYPIKSAKGIAVASARLTESGLFLDREWMVVKEEGGKFITARQIPKLLLVEPSVPHEVLEGGSWAACPPGAVMRVSAPGMPSPLLLPLRPPDRSSYSQLRTVTVWEWTGSAADEGDDAAAWFSQALGTPCRLVRYLGTASQPPPASEGGERVVRPVDPAFAAGYETRFADAYPVLAASQSSLADLNSRLAAPLTMDRFRPNVVVAGSGPWEEDSWTEVVVSRRGAGAG